MFFKDNRVTLSRKGWFIKIQKFSFFKSAESFGHFCPFFWLTVAAVLVSPVMAVVRGAGLLLKGLAAVVWWLLERMDMLFESMDQAICRGCDATGIFDRAVDRLPKMDGWHPDNNPRYLVSEEVMGALGRGFDALVERFVRDASKVSDVHKAKRAALRLKWWQEAHPGVNLAEELRRISELRVKQHQDWETQRKAEKAELDKVWKARQMKIALATQKWAPLVGLLLAVGALAGIEWFLHSKGWDVVAVKAIAKYTPIILNNIGWFFSVAIWQALWIVALAAVMVAIVAGVVIGGRALYRYLDARTNGPGWDFLKRMWSIAWRVLLFVYVGKGIWAVLKFVGIMIKAVYEKNCPAIEWKD